MHVLTYKWDPYYVLRRIPKFREFEKFGDYRHPDTGKERGPGIRRVERWNWQLQIFVEDRMHTQQRKQLPREPNTP